MPEPSLYAVVMAGGTGTRFWPASRAARPKQFLAIASEQSLLAATIERLAGLVPIERVIVVTAEALEQQTREQLPGLPAENLLAEPEGRNTLPCVAWAASEVRRRDPEAVLAVLSADHVIEPAQSFRDLLGAAACAAAAAPSALFTLGVRPTEAATGFGYIELGDVLGEESGFEISRVARFIEKPGSERAEAYLKSGRHLWNSGIFVWSVAAISAALARCAPETWRALRDADRSEARAAYPGLEAISIDVGVLERADDVRVLPLAFAWNDVGSWSALTQVIEGDENGNFRAGDAALVAEDARGCVVYGEPGGLTALVGVDDLIVVHAGSATLVLPRDRAQDVKSIVERLRREHPDFL